GVVARDRRTALGAHPRGSGLARLFGALVRDVRRAARSHGARCASREPRVRNRVGGLPATRRSRGGASALDHHHRRSLPSSRAFPSQARGPRPSRPRGGVVQKATLKGKFFRTMLLVTAVVGLATLAIVVVTSIQASSRHLADVQ